MNNQADLLAKQTLNNSSDNTYFHPWKYSREYITLNLNETICNNKKRNYK